jgi:two-component system nitrate/nitrite response regulator NarL
MSEPASQPFPLRSLRVAISASDAALHAKLTQLVQAAGHNVVGTTDAQVILCDAETPAGQTPTVALGHSDHHHAGRLPRNAGAIEIDAALRAVAAGLVVHPPYSAPDAFEELPDRIATDLLTPRELQVLTAISAGMSNKAVARSLGISLHTVKFHVESLFRKLGARSRAEAVARGLDRRRAETVEI